MKSKKHVIVDGFDCDAIQQTDHEFYTRKEFPTLEKLFQILKEKELFLGGCTTLWKFLKKIEFRYNKVNISVM